MVEKRTCGLVVHRVQDSSFQTFTHWHPKRLRYYYGFNFAQTTEERKQTKAEFVQTTDHFSPNSEEYETIDDLR